MQERLSASLKIRNENKGPCCISVLCKGSDGCGHSLDSVEDSLGSVLQCIHKLLGVIVKLHSHNKGADSVRKKRHFILHMRFGSGACWQLSSDKHQHAEQNLTANSTARNA